MDHLREDDGKQHTYLDPDGCGSGTGWVFVIVAAPTGVVYRNQSGGYSCAQYEQEGYLIPLFGSDLDEELKQIVVGELRGWGMRGQQWPVSCSTGCGPPSAPSRCTAPAAMTSCIRRH
ncbi:DUF6210 family protein [Streptomyces sp. NBC_01744]|nr:DUF6210 family protein [Streptomyces sp. NBC_01744]